MTNVFPPPTALNSSTDPRHEQVVFCQDRHSGLRAIIAIYSTALGPGARRDPLLPLPERGRGAGRRAEPVPGDGLQERAGRPRPRRRQGRHHRRSRHATSPRRCCAPTAGSSSRSAAATSPRATSAPTARTWTSSPGSAGYVTGRTVPNGGAGDSSVLTAFGVFQGMRAAAEHRWGAPAWTGAWSASRASARSAGGWSSHLVEDGRDGRDLRREPGCGQPGRGRAPGGAGGRRHRADAGPRQLDVYAPCALGGALDDDTVAALRASIVCGGANNQLAHPGIEKLLADRGVLYAPDYVVNAGGVIQVADELAGFNFDRAQGRAAQIYGTTRQIFALADDRGSAAGGRRRPAGRAPDVRGGQAARDLAGWVRLRRPPGGSGRATGQELMRVNQACSHPVEALTAQSRYGWICTQAGSASHLKR